MEPNDCHRLKTHKCPTCGYAMDAATGVGHANAPKPGDWTLCFGCGEALTFTETLGVRVPNPRERFQLEESPQWVVVKRTQERIRAMRRPR